MEFSLIQTILGLSLIEISVLSIVGIVIIYISLFRGMHTIMFMLVLSASLVGSNIPLVNNIAPLIRWLSIFLLLIVAIHQGKLTLSFGYVVFWGYVGFGFICLSRAINPSWQLQKSILLLLVALTIPFAYSSETYKSFKLSLVSISVVATFFSILCFISLPSQLSEAHRFSGVSKGAPTFALVLGGMLPFIFWGLWKSNRKAVEIACGFGFLFGTAALIFSGQRTGTIAGMIGLIPLIIASQQRKTVGWAVLLVILLALPGYFLFQQSSAFIIAYGLGLLFSIVAFIFSARRSRNIAEVIDLIPLLPFLITFLQRKRIRYPVFLVILLFCLGYFLLQKSSVERTNFLLSRYSLDSGLSGREVIWDNAFSEIKKNPFLGRGIGASETVIVNSFHNTYLEIWFNTGIFGLFMFLTSQLYFFYRIVYLSRISKDPEIKSFLALALGYMLGFIVICTFESSGGGASNVNLIIYLLLGVLVSNNHLINSTELSNSRKHLRQ